MLQLSNLRGFFLLDSCFLIADLKGSNGEEVVRVVDGRDCFEYCVCETKMVYLGNT